MATTPKTGVICRELTDNPSTEATNTETRDAASLLAEYKSLDKELQTKALSARDLIENEVVPLLIRMHALLSQRGSEHLRLEAELPTWTEYYEHFRWKFNLKSLRTFQRQLASERGGSSAIEEEYLSMLLAVLSQIEQTSEPVPSGIMNIAAECRRRLNVFNGAAARRVHMLTSGKWKTGVTDANKTFEI
jgi:hypothetical protein